MGLVDVIPLVLPATVKRAITASRAIRARLYLLINLAHVIPHARLVIMRLILGVQVAILVQLWLLRHPVYANASVIVQHAVTIQFIPASFV